MGIFEGKNLANKQCFAQTKSFILQFMDTLYTIRQAFFTKALILAISLT